MKKLSLEICCYSLESAFRAAKIGAHRVELCAGKPEGGITPSAGFLREAASVKNIQILPILRPRGGDFCYSDFEFRQMVHDLELMQELGFPGVVTGILLPSGEADLHRLSQLKRMAGNMEFCIHRCIDLSSNSLVMLEELIHIGVKRVLSSGRKNTAIEGIEHLCELVDLAGDRIEVMAGSGVHSSNISLLKKAGVQHFHASAGKTENSPMLYRNGEVKMGKELGTDEYARYEADENEIQSMLNLLS